LSAGDAAFTLVDVAYVGQVAAKILTESQNYINKGYELTDNEMLTSTEMDEKIK